MLEASRHGSACWKARHQLSYIPASAPYMQALKRGRGVRFCAAIALCMANMANQTKLFTKPKHVIAAAGLHRANKGHATSFMLY